MLGKQFSTREELIEFCYNYYIQKRTVTVISRSDSKKNIVEIGCDRGGQYRSKHTQTNKPRSTKTMKTNCKFKIKCKLISDKWTISHVNEEHNHEIDEELIAHSFYRRINKETYEEIKMKSLEGFQPKQILKTIKDKDEGAEFIRRDIYNARNKIFKEELNNMTPSEKTIEFFNNNNYTYNYQNDEEGSINSIFFSNSKELSIQYNRVFILDCTYCTNQYKYPLLNIVGISSTNMTFSSAFIFMRNENQEYYEWALSQFKIFIEYSNTNIVFSCDRDLSLINAIKIVFPLSNIILCQWHINMNVLSNTKSDFKTEEEFTEFLNFWNIVIHSKTEEEYIKSYDELKLKYSQTHLKPIEYLDKTWKPWKTYFVSCYIDMHRHYGSNTSSRVEGFHNSLKGYLGSAKCHIYSIVKKIDAMLKAQMTEIKHQENSDKIKINTNYDKTIFQELFYKVSQFAMAKIMEQLNIAIVRPCSGMFTHSYGIPCVHKLRILLSGSPSIPLSAIDKQWYLRQEHIIVNPQPDNVEEVMENMFNTYNNVSTGQQRVLLSHINKSLESVINYKEPKIRENNNKGRKRKHTKSIKRNPSQFEIVDLNFKRYRCAKCKEKGHTINNCPNKYFFM